MRCAPVRASRRAPSSSASTWPSMRIFMHGRASDQRTAWMGGLGLALFTSPSLSQYAVLRAAMHDAFQNRLIGVPVVPVEALLRRSLFPAGQALAW